MEACASDGTFRVWDLSFSRLRDREINPTDAAATSNAPANIRKIDVGSTPAPMRKPTSMGDKNDMVRPTPNIKPTPVARERVSKSEGPNAKKPAFAPVAN